jgi:hypothetical protein
MKKLIALLLLLCVTARANLVTVTLTITNTPANGATIASGADSRFWTNLLTSASTQILTTNTTSLNASNLFSATALAPFNGGSTRVSNWSGASIVTYFAQSPFTFTVSAGWCSVSYFTNTATNGTVVEVPMGNFTPNAATNMASLLVSGIDVNSTNSFAQGDVALSNYASISNAQTIGNKMFTNSLFIGGTNLNAVISNSPAISGNVGGGGLTNGAWTNPQFTNGQNFGNPFRSPGGGTGSEQFGLSANAATNFAIAIGDHASATNQYAEAYGYGADAFGQFSIAAGYQSEAQFNYDTAFGAASLASGGASTAIGAASTASFTNSTALGAQASTTIANQVAIGGAGSSVWISGPAEIDGGISNLTSVAGGTNNFKGVITTPTYANSGLANGANADLNFGTNSYVVVSGPSSAFTINGIAANVDGAWLTIENSTGQSMTIANQSGVEPTAANRIITGPAADFVTTNNPGVVTLRYKGAISRWIMTSHN